MVNRTAQPSHERRSLPSWHYPPVWDGVVWMPHRTPLRDALRRYGDVAAFAATAIALVWTLGSILTAIATIAADMAVR